MELFWFASTLILSALLAVALGMFFVRYFSEPRGASGWFNFVTTSAIAMVLFALFLIPIDVYNVSYGVNGLGEHLDPHPMAKAGEALKYISYSMYILVLVFVFMLIPLMYFYKEDEELDKQTRFKIGAIHMAGGIATFLAFLILALIYRRTRGIPERDWVYDVGTGYTVGDAIFGFCFYVFAIVGLSLWLLYTAYGLAAVPIALCLQRSTLEHTVLRAEDDQQELARRLKAVRDAMNNLSSRYDLAGREWTPEHRKKHNELKRDEEVLSAQLDNVASLLNPDLETSFWHCLAPFRYVIGTFFFFVSLFLALSYLLGSVDRMANSHCGASCGFLLPEGTLFAFTDQFLTVCAKVYPVDWVVNVFVIIYFLCASVFGMIAFGVRICGYKLTSIRRVGTEPKDLLLAGGVLMVVLVVIVCQTLSFTPQYATLGTQFYRPQYNVTGNNQTITVLGDPIPCSLDMDTEHRLLFPHTCEPTQVSVMLNKFHSKMPFFGSILVIANVFFFTVYAVSTVYVISRARKEISPFRTGEAVDYRFDT